MPTTSPLLAFSIYLSGRNQALLALAHEITEKLDACISNAGIVSHEPRARASDLMWLWTLGAYEVTRTLCQARECFSDRFYRDVADLKIDLERVRVPNTKMEKIKYDRKAPAIPVPSNRGPDLWDDKNKDLLVGDPANVVSARNLLRHYDRVMASLTIEDVKMSHEDSFATTGASRRSSE